MVAMAVSFQSIQFTLEFTWIFFQIFTFFLLIKFKHDKVVATEKKNQILKVHEKKRHKTLTFTNVYQFLSIFNLNVDFFFIWISIILLTIHSKIINTVQEKTQAHSNLFVFIFYYKFQRAHTKRYYTNISTLYLLCSPHKTLSFWKQIVRVFFFVFWLFMILIVTFVSNVFAAYFECSHFRVSFCC